MYIRNLMINLYKSNFITILKELTNINYHNFKSFLSKSDKIRFNILIYGV